MSDSEASNMSDSGSDVSNRSRRSVRSNRLVGNRPNQAVLQTFVKLYEQNNVFSTFFYCSDLRRGHARVLAHVQYRVPVRDLDQPAPV